MLSEVSQFEKDNHYMVSLIQGIKETVKGIIGERRENDWEKLKRETNYERFLTLGNKGLWKERWVGGWSN